MSRAPVVIVVSIAKSGTHLVGELMKALGYRVYGPSGPGGFGEPATPAIMETLYTDPLALPAGTCVVVHSLPLEGVPGPMATLWHRTGQPAILFNYRDPRDVICSTVRFLMRQTHAGGFIESAPALAHSAIMGAMPGPRERLLHAITNPTMPYWDVFRQLSWLRLHPLALDVSFERLVGAAGGGSDADQTQQIGEVLHHLSILGNPRSYAAGIFRRDTPVFSKGQIGAWRREFEAVHVEAFNRRFEGVLELYGYEVVDAAGFTPDAG